jgi:DNA modification methylase
MTALVIRADARQLPLPDASVDLIVTSPPYYGLRSYTDNGEHYADQIGAEASPGEYIDSLIACTAEWARVVKPTGSIFVNLGDSYYSGKGAPGKTTVDAKNGGRTARRVGVSPLDRSDLGYPRKTLLMLPERYRIACLDKLGLVVRSVIVWDKPNALPERVTDRVRRSHEDWVHLTREPRYFADIDDLRLEPSGYSRPGANRATPPGQRRRTMADTCNPLGALPGSVWNIASEPLTVPAELGVDHFAAFPMEWPRRLIKGWSPIGGTVLDPFGGTGTTALVASVHGRTGITVDRSADYCRIAEWRTTDPAQRAKALGVDKPPVQLPGQAELFALAAA